MTAWAVLWLSKGGRWSVTWALSFAVPADRLMSVAGTPWEDGDADPLEGEEAEA